MFFSTTDALTYNATRWDRIRWSGRADGSNSIRDTERALAEMIREEGVENLHEDRGSHELARTFAGEVFSRLAEDPAEVDSPAGWAATAQGVVSEVEEFEALRAAVAHDADMAALATREILKTVTERLPAMLDAEYNEEGKPEAEAERDARRARAAMRAALRRAYADAADQVTEAREALEGLAPGMGATPTAHEQEDTTRLTLAEMLLADPRFRDVLRRAGKLRRMAQADAKVRARGVGTVVGLERGADLGRVLPSQLARLAHPRMRMLAMKDLAERALVQYRIEGHEPQGRGPIVLLVDESGSMEGEPQRWARAAVIAAIRQGQAERRPVGICYFNSRVRDAFLMDADGTAHTATRQAPAERLSPFGQVRHLVQDALTRDASGGTDFTAPFEWALSILEGEQEKADVILVTDGWADATPETRERWAAQRERGTRAYGLTVGGGEIADGLCDEAIPLDQVPEDEIADRLAKVVPTTP